MAVQLRPIVFGSYAAMAGHLDRWAARTLTTPEAWEAALVRSHAWLEFAPRNQVLLLSYGIDGPVAGAETWRFVPSADGRGCGVRAGEHGFPVRGPITTGGREPDPFVGGTRPTRSHVERWEWRPVFSVDQLARRPLPASLTPVEIPETLTGDGGYDEFTRAVGRVRASVHSTCCTPSVPTLSQLLRLLAVNHGHWRSIRLLVSGPSSRYNAC